jgi:hypothetical protein
MSAYTSMNLTELLNHRDQISAEIFRQTGDASVVPMTSANSGGKVKLTKTGKVRKPSSNKGKPTARGDFAKKICEENKAEYETYKEDHNEQKGAHLIWISAYIKEHQQEYEAFKAAWALEHPKEASDAESAEPGEGEATSAAANGAEAKPKKVLSPEHLAKMKAGREAKLAEKKAAKEQLEAAVKANSPISLAPLVEEAQAQPQPVPKPMKGPKKVTKKAEAVVTPVVAPVVAQEEAEPEQLPFKHNGVTYIRIGVAKADGNHEWASTDLWHSKKGARAGYAGELMEDGSINEDAEEPALV